MSYLTVAQVAAECSSRPKPVGIERVYKWCKCGCKTKDGRYVKLKPTRLPGGIAFRREDVDRFIAELQGPIEPMTGVAVVARRVPRATTRVGPGFARCAAGEVGEYPKGKASRDQGIKASSGGKKTSGLRGCVA